MDSVFSLVNALCESFCINAQGRPEEKRKVIKACRKNAFEILFETGNQNNFNGTRKDIIEELKIHHFALKLRADTIKKKHEADEFEELLSQLSQNGPLDAATSNVLELLLALKDGATGNGSEDDANGVIVSTLLLLPLNLITILSVISIETVFRKVSRHTQQHKLSTNTTKEIFYARTCDKFLR